MPSYIEKRDFKDKLKALSDYYWDMFCSHFWMYWTAPLVVLLTCAALVATWTTTRDQEDSTWSTSPVTFLFIRLSLSWLACGWIPGIIRGLFYRRTYHQEKRSLELTTGLTTETVDD